MCLGGGRHLSGTDGGEGRGLAACDTRTRKLSKLYRDDSSTIVYWQAPGEQGKGTEYHPQARSHDAPHFSPMDVNDHGHATDRPGLIRPLP